MRKPKAQKPKKPFFKRWWFWMILAVFIIGMIGSSPTNNPDTASVTSASAEPTPNPTEKPTPTIEPIQTQKPEPISTPTSELTPEPTLELTPSSMATVSLESLGTVVEAMLAENDSDCNVTCGENFMTVNVWSDGVAQALAYIQSSGGDANDENWTTAKESTVAMATSIRELMNTAGLNDSILMVNVLNDLNHDNLPLSILNTTIFYDVLAE